MPPALRARHVEAIGRRGGGNDGVRLALAQAAAGGTASPPPGRPGAQRGAAAGSGGGGGGGGGGGAGRGGDVERRFDVDGELYTRAEFVQEYGGTAERDRARRPPPPAPPPAQGSSVPSSNPRKGGKKKGGGCEGAAGGVSADGVDEGANAILIFLSGFKEIQTLHEARRDPIRP